ncbi:BON domain-containing protein [Roseateles sp.]|uniref:BON domain-containing protein n=1 Tax=Roseateles sp. TaxID=1971397 RepID=UPI003265DF82
MTFFWAKKREPRSLLNPDGTVRVADTAPRTQKVVVAAAPRPRSRVLPWLLALGAGAAIALVAVVAMQDPRSVGTQLDAAVTNVKDVRTQAEQAVIDSQNAAADASRDAVNGVGTAVADAGITTKVKAALAVDPALSASRIEVQTDNGVVRLDGPAPDAAAKARATVLAGAPAGVRGVDNRLALPQPGSVVAVADAASRPGQ